MARNEMMWRRDQTAIDISRSKQNLSHRYKGSFNAGKLYPLWSYSDILPGDTIKLNLASLIRMSTPIGPVMDDMYADVYCFFTPHKLTMQRYSQPNLTISYSWKYFIGAQDYFLNMPVPSGTFPLPRFYSSAANGSLALGSFYERLGLPDGVDVMDHTTFVGGGYLSSFHSLDYLSYISVWNDFFRDENTILPVAFSFTINSGAPYVSFYGGPLNWQGVSFPFSNGENSILPVSRPHGYFGSALPWPQKSISGVTIPLLGNADVSAAGILTLQDINGSGQLTGNDLMLENAGATLSPTGRGPVNLYNDSSSGVSANSALAYKSGLYVDLSQVSSVTINQLRALIAKQHFEEALARGGNRLGEMSASLFGVTPHDAGDDHSEYLGGARIPIVISEVEQTAPTTSGTGGIGVGALGANSKTIDKSFLFEKSFDTWGTLQVFIAFRTAESFNQGLPRRLSRSTRDDFYFPAFARIGDQPVLNKEIFYAPENVNGNHDQNNAVFGYQFAWAEYHYEPDYVTGVFRTAPMKAWTYTNEFATLPTLAGYLAGGDAIKANVDKTLQASSATTGFQFIGDFYFDCEAIRPMPADTRPGLTRI